MQIKNLEIKNNLILAPLAGIADVGFRKVCIDMGADLTFTEMVSIKGLKYDNAKTKELLKKAENEKVVGVQVFGNDPNDFSQMIGMGALDSFDVLDINMGCPVPKVANNGAGARLMLDEDLAESIIKACVKATTKPVTVKFRKGWDDSFVNAVDFAKMCEGAGASAVTVHGRTRAQMYTGFADLKIIESVKKAVKIPVIGNGDVTNLNSYKKMTETGCDAVMIARGAIGSPWLFADLLGKPFLGNKFDVMREHFNLLKESTDEYHAVVNMRKHFSQYFKNLKISANFRNEINMLKTQKEIFDLLERLEKF